MWAPCWKPAAQLLGHVFLWAVSVQPSWNVPIQAPTGRDAGVLSTWPALWLGALVVNNQDTNVWDRHQWGEDVGRGHQGQRRSGGRVSGPGRQAAARGAAAAQPGPGRDLPLRGPARSAGGRAPRPCSRVGAGGSVESCDFYDAHISRIVQFEMWAAVAVPMALQSLS